MTFIAWLIQGFGLQMKKKLLKKSLLVMYISSFLTNCELKIRVKTFKNQKSQKSFLVTFIAWLIQSFGLQMRKCL